MQNSSSPRPQCRLPFPPFFPPFCPCHTRLAWGGPVSLSGPPFPHVFIARPRTLVLQLLRECVADVAEGLSPPKTFCSRLLLSTWPCRPPSAPGAGEGLSHRTRRPKGVTRGPSSQALSGRLQERLSRTHLALMAFALGKPCLSLLPSINPACTCCICLCVSCSARPRLCLQDLMRLITKASLCSALARCRWRAAVRLGLGPMFTMFIRHGRKRVSTPMGSWQVPCRGSAAKLDSLGGFLTTKPLSGSSEDSWLQGSSQP